ncbi:hypothetical protein JCM1841_003011 [Sporobolomyces salmonicolor]
MGSPSLSPDPFLVVPPSPSPKSVTFSPSPAPSASASASASASISTALPDKPATKRRRSSIKQGVQMPYKPPKEQYSHPDPLIRRLRLRNGYGKEVNLQTEFRDAKVVLFFFGATWRGSSTDPFQTVAAFAKRQPHQLKVVYVSIDDTKEAYDANTLQKPWLAMEWNDGSNVSTHLPTPSSPLPPSPDPLEPFLLAGDSDLEEEVHQTDPTGQLYLRPFSRVYLAEKWTVLGVPNLVAYHVESQKILSYHARFELLRDGKMEGTWDKWSKGERIQFSVVDLIYALRWTISIAIVAAAYLFAVHSGSMPNYIQNWSAQLTQNYLTGSAPR